jgi:hypothetical protein
VSVAWSGADPSSFQDSGVDYELGVRYLVGADISITGIRIYGPATSASLANRKAYIRTTTDTILATVVLPNTLTAGWQTYNLVTPLAVDSGTTIWTTYGTLTDYTAVTSPGYPRASADAAVTANLGGFSDTVGNLPTTTVQTFYGVDFVYDVVPSTAPIVGITIARSGLSATATLTVSDDHPDAVTYSIEWGDGNTSSVTGLGPHAHTYAAAGLYVVLVTATDQDDLTDAAATSVLILTPGTIDVEAIHEAIATAGATITGLRCFASLPGAINPPTFAPVEFEQDYHQTFGNAGGLTVLTFTCGVYTPDTPEGRKLLLPYLAPAGDGSILAALESDKTLGGTVKTLIVRRVRGAYRLYEVGDTTYLGAMIEITVWA